MRTNLLLSWIVIGAIGGSCVAQGTVGITEVTINPAQPRELQQASVTIRGWKPGSGYRIYDAHERIENASIYIDLYWDVPEPGTTEPEPYEYTVPVGTLRVGTYAYTVYVSFFGALSDSATTTFTVSPAVYSIDPVLSPEPGFGQPVSGGLVGIGGIAQPLSPQPTGLFEQMKQQMQDRINNPAGSTLQLPGVDIQHVSWSDVTGIKEGISSLKIDPANPTPSDEVSVTVVGWKPASNLVVGNAAVRIEGQTIWLDLYWQEQASPPPATACGGSMGQMEACSFSLTVTQYDLTPPYDGVPYEYAKSLGTFAAGTYTLNVANHDKVSGSKSTTFTVKSAATGQGQPWPAWLAEFLAR
jgi:hypothetical protein